MNIEIAPLSFDGSSASQSTKASSAVGEFEIRVGGDGATLILPISLLLDGVPIRHFENWMKAHDACEKEYHVRIQKLINETVFGGSKMKGAVRLIIPQTDGIVHALD